MFVCLLISLLVHIQKHQNMVSRQCQAWIRTLVRSKVINVFLNSTCWYRWHSANSIPSAKRGRSIKFILKNIIHGMWTYGEKFEIQWSFCLHWGTFWYSLSSVDHLLPQICEGDKIIPDSEKERGTSYVNCTLTLQLYILL